jgi:hypothetical protein
MFGMSLGFLHAPETGYIAQGGSHGQTVED